MSKKQEIELKQRTLLQGLQQEERAYADFLQNLKPEKRKRITSSLGNMKHGLHAVAPITCLGPKKCPFINHCPIPSVEEKQRATYGPDTDYPMMMPCVLETMYQRQKIIEYVQHLEVDPDNPVEIAIVNELAILDLHKNRALMVMSEGDRDGHGRDFLRQDENWQEAGDQAHRVLSTTLHPVFEVLDRLERRRERLLERLMQTRRSQAEYDLKRGKNVEDSNVLKEIQAVRQYLQEASARTITGDGDDQQAILVDD